MKNLLLAILSGLLLSFSWVSIGFFPLIFFAFVPLLILSDKILRIKTKNKSKMMFFYSFFAFLIFNVITTYWVWHATPYGAIAAFFINSLLMSISFLLFFQLRKINKRLSNIGFVIFWISFEYLHLNWDLSWPWLTLGNVFANFPSIIQWYEYTGFLGGSLWVLTANLLIYFCFLSRTRREMIITLFVLIFPIIISQFLEREYKSKENLEVVVVQPNIDPYIDKFTIGYEEQLNDFINLAKNKITQNTDLLLGPETALIEGVWENKIEVSTSVNLLRQLQSDFPNLNILVGATTYKLFGKQEVLSETARQIRNQNIFYDVFNSAIFIPNSGPIEVYHKTKLVPGAEKMPFPKLLDNLGSLMIDLGGTQGSLGSQNNNSPFQVKGNVIKPLICYESVYGDLDNGSSNVISIITNDGWWKNTAGYKQHLAYARIRSIEQRKPIIRSANTGISAIIDLNGNIVKRSKWNERICLSGIINLNHEDTFYSSFGDYIGRLCLFISFIILTTSLVRSRVNKFS